MAASFPAAATGVVDEFAPVSPLTVSFGATVAAIEGSQLSPAAVAVEPTLTWAADPAKKYTIIFSDPDAPNPTDPKFGEWIHWLVINASGSNARSGDTMVPYFGSAPGNGAGVHRYCFVVYEQSGIVAAEEPRVGHRRFVSVSAAMIREEETSKLGVFGTGRSLSLFWAAGPPLSTRLDEPIYPQSWLLRCLISSTRLAAWPSVPPLTCTHACSGFPPRRSFKSREFAAKHGLTPVAVLTFRAEWDESVPELVKAIMPETC